MDYMAVTGKWVESMNDFDNRNFEDAYAEVYRSVVKEGIPQKSHCVLFLGGQPGSGKSNFYSQDNNLNGYIVIDGDKYRSFHPEYENIVKYDLDNYVERTQPFVNFCIEKLISNLSDEGYNLIIEGTLRDPDVPLSTCRSLVEKGYRADLYVMAVDACISWQSTINRADLMIDLKETPRLVPIDKYNVIVNNLPENLRKIETSGLFSSIRVIDRDNKILYPNSRGISASETLKKVLNLEKWNQAFDETANEFLAEKIEVLQNQRRRRGR
jgi:UDP-N-acetylglucosamine kinase